MARIAKRVQTLAAVVVAVGALALVSPTASYAADAGTCSGGSVPAGSYSSLTITGFCTVDAGTVNVENDVIVGHRGELIAAFGGSDLHVGGNLSVKGPNGVLILGCEPKAFVCVNDPDQRKGTLTTDDTIGLNLTTQGALAVIVHASTIGGDSKVHGGGGGVTCASTIPHVPGPPAYIDFEDNTIGGDSTIQGVQSCWAGYIRNTISGSVFYRQNTFSDPDASELTTNVVGRNMICFHNSPAVQFGDSTGTPDIVGGAVLGECKNVVS
jgi:hypothetical protein